MSFLGPIIPLQPNGPGPDYLLADAVITFQTTGDDKDPDTIVDIRLAPLVPAPAKGAPFVNYRGTLAGHLASNTTYKMNLPFLNGTVVTDGKQYVLDIVIEPKGHDTWKFDLTLDVDFQADRRTRHQYWPGIVLSQNNLKAEFVFYL